MRRNLPDRGYVNGAPPLGRPKRERAGLRPSTVVLLSVVFALVVLVCIIADINVYDFPGLLPGSPTSPEVTCLPSPDATGLSSAACSPSSPLSPS